MNFKSIIFLLFIFSQNIYSQLGKDIDDIRDIEKKELISRVTDNNSTRLTFSSPPKIINGKKCEEIIIYHINNETALCDMISYVSCSASANLYAKDLNKIGVLIGTNKWKNYENNTIYKLEVDKNMVIVEQYKDENVVKKKIELCKGAELLFYKSGSKLSNSDMNKIYLESELYLSDNKLFFIVDFKDTNNGSVDFNAYPKFIDLSGNGEKDLYITYGNTYTSGMVGENIAIFSKKNKEGSFKKILDIPMISFNVLNNKTNNFYDIEIGGRGFKTPVWKFNGTKYKFSHHKKE